MKGYLGLMVAVAVLCAALGFAQKKREETGKHPSGLASAPDSAHGRVNPYEGKLEAAQAGRKLFERHCVECHGADAHGRGKAPALDSGEVEQAPPGDLFWFLTNGGLRAGMPSWSRLPDAQRWQIVTFLKTFRKPPAPLGHSVPEPQ